MYVSLQRGVYLTIYRTYSLPDAADDAACSLSVFLEMKCRVSAVDYDRVTGEFDVVRGVYCPYI